MRNFSQLAARFSWVYNYFLMNVSLRLTSRLLPILVILTGLLALVEASRVWKFLFCGLGLAWLLAYLWARSLGNGLRLTRQMRFGWAQVGDRLEERFILENTGWAPALWAQVVDYSEVPGYSANSVTGLGAPARLSWHNSGVCSQRGVFNLGPTSLKCSDPFGFYTVMIHDPRSVSLMVTPPVVPLPKIEIARGGQSGDGHPRPELLDRTVSAAGVRGISPATACA